MVPSTIPRNRRTRERTTVAKWQHYTKGKLCFRGRPFDSEGGEGWKILSEQIIYFQHELDQNIYFQVYLGQTFLFLSATKFWKSKKTKPKKKTDTKKPERGGGSECWFRWVPGPGQDFPWDFFLFLHTTRFCMCMCICIIVSKRIVIEGGFGILPNNYF